MDLLKGALRATNDFFNPDDNKKAVEALIQQQRQSLEESAKNKQDPGEVLMKFLEHQHQILLEERKEKGQSQVAIMQMMEQQRKLLDKMDKIEDEQTRVREEKLRKGCGCFSR